MKNIVIKAFFIAGGILGTIAVALPAAAQIRPLGTQYYENQYMSNPAFAGMEEGLNVNLSYRNQWRTIEGSPVTMAASGDYRRDKVGMGLIVYSDKAGLIGRTRVMASYAYHLSLNGDNKNLHFGLSLGMMKESLDNNKIVAEPDDVLAQRFNQRKPYIDGDFGIAYTNDRFTIQGALPNLSKFLKKDELNMIDGSTYFAAMSYKIGTALDVVSIEPKISFRGAKDIEGIWDVGTNLKLENNILSFMGMFRSDKSSVFGVGVNYDKYFIQCFYTSQLAGDRMRTGGDFEVNLKINLFKQQK
ncbi:MAG: PorP/SprF family type IX secretion system membrane protein [Candidatus Pedobacter colombiensis]|uniref:PorP/SprF family type IX secretion system membrane protein n=1 Tax=Candidatus Pedobacter colombiensis TaxID=3121371 RepID=A0AAJ5W4Z0_9SPHI|nr:PorP/SprF family type IX secretion system membrane protein [Pedobacter sp.]WEK18144.1 MAG: PorP/SprF family type IX secretion system membrane protein [Pedobacter sp.]